MGDAALVAVLLAAFGLAIGLAQVFGRLIGSTGQDGWADEPPDSGGVTVTAADPDVNGPGRPQ